MSPNLADPSLPESGPAPCPPAPSDPQHGPGGRKEYPVADFIDPVEWVWSKDDVKIDRAVQEWSEQTHADY
jgi:hypothetical protein